MLRQALQVQLVLLCMLASVSAKLQYNRSIPSSRICPCGTSSSGTWTRMASPWKFESVSGGAMLRRHDREESLHVQAQTYAKRKGAVFIQGPLEGSRRRPAQEAGEFETGAGACTAGPAERRHHRQPHALHRLAAAHGARLPGRRGAQEAWA